MKPTIYLGGPMSGLTWRDALEWRRTVEDKLHSQWRLISPVKQQVGQDLDEIITVQSQDDNKLLLHHTATGVTSQDEFYIDQSDWLLCYFLNAQRVSIGTIWEIGYAWGKGKKILSVVEKGSIHDHPFVRRRSHVFTPNLSEAIEFFKAIAVG